MKLVLDPSTWYRARLEQDPEAVAWVDSLGKNGSRNSILELELLDEGRLAYLEMLHPQPREMKGYAYQCSPCRCPCRRCRRWGHVGMVRRYYTGPVPPQVLAAFKVRN